MSVTTSFRIVSRLGLAAVGLMFGLIVLGSIVRTTGSGLACPDWPLCHGRLIPPLEFNVLIEWFHRLVALLVSLLLAGVVGMVAFHRELRARLGALAGLMVLLLAAQILLGALTVWKLLDPSIVGGHLAVALLLFSTLLTTTLVAQRESAAGAEALAPRPQGLLPLLGGACVFIFAQAVLGGIVSASHASLACPDWPTCNGEWFPPLQGLVGLQMTHRWAAYLLTLYLGVVAWRARAAADPVVARVGSLLVALTLGQIAVGVLNVLLGIQVLISAFHLANATGMLALTVAATFHVSRMPSRRAALAPALVS